MGSTDPQQLVFLYMGLNTLILVVCCAVTWHLSRAKKVRALEDAILSAMRVGRERADQVDLKIGEWQVTIQALLAEVEEFFERSVKERKRTQAAATRAADPMTAPGNDLAMLSRADQINVVRGVFAAQDR